MPALRWFPRAVSKTSASHTDEDGSPSAPQRDAYALSEVTVRLGVEQHIVRALRY